MDLTVETADGRRHKVAWCGVNQRDLFLELAEETFADAFTAFCNHANTQRLTYSDTKETITYDGYTELQGVQRMEPSGHIRIDLKKPEVFP